MKSLIVLAILCLFCIELKAQNVFGLNRKNADDALINHGFKWNRHLNLSPTMSSDEYKPSDQEHQNDMNIICYFNSHEVCFEYKEIMPAGFVFNALESLNKAFIKVDNNHWINKIGTVKATYDPPSNGTFFISYRALDISE